eukprot:13489277-Alexandrium_andersonii.AAC.1
MGSKIPPPAPPRVQRTNAVHAKPHVWTTATTTVAITPSEVMASPSFPIALCDDPCGRRRDKGSA